MNQLSNFYFIEGDIKQSFYYLLKNSSNDEILEYIRNKILKNTKYNDLMSNWNEKKLILALNELILPDWNFHIKIKDTDVFKSNFQIRKILNLNSKNDFEYIKLNRLLIEKLYPSCIEKTHIHSGIHGLDILLQGGFILPNAETGFVLLIQGNSGAGKSTLALQSAINISNQLIQTHPLFTNKELEDKFRLSYFSNEQKFEDIMNRCDEIGLIGFNNEQITFDELQKSVISKLSSQTNDSVSNLEWIEQIKKQIMKNIKNNLTNYDIIDEIESENRLKNNKYNTIVIDNINNIDENSLETFISEIKKMSHFTIIVSNTKQGEIIDKYADMTLSISSETNPILGYSNNLIKISKSRYQHVVQGFHLLKIKRTKGIIVYPSIHYYTHKSNYLLQEVHDSFRNLLNVTNEFHSFHKDQTNLINDNSIICRLLKLSNKSTLRLGSQTVILGDKNSFKTYITKNFLLHGSKENSENGLLLSLNENKYTLLENLPAGNKGLENVFLLNFRSGALTPNEFFYYLSKRLTLSNHFRGDNKTSIINRIAFNDLSQIDYRYPLLKNEPLFLTALMDYFKYSTYGKIISDNILYDFKFNNITALYTGSLSCSLAPYSRNIADNVILCKLVGDKVHFIVDKIEGHPGIKKYYYMKIKNGILSEEEIFEDTQNSSKILIEV